MSNQAKIKPKTSITASDELRELQKNAHLIQEDIDPDQYFPPVMDEPLTSGERAIMNVLDELGEIEGAQLRVYREVKGQPNEFLFQPDFTDDLLGSVMATIQEFYGKGQYRLQARIPGGQLKMNQLISVGDAPKRKEPEKPVIEKDTSITDMMQMQMQMAERSKADMLHMFTMMQNSQTQMIQALMGRESPAPTEGLSLKDVLSLVPLLQGDKSSGIDSLLKGIELGKELGGGGGDDGMIGLAKSALGGITEFAKNIPQPQATQPVYRQPNPAALPPQQPQPQTAPVVNNDAVLMDELTALVKILASAAARGSDPEIYAELLLDTLGDDQGAMLCGDPANMAMITENYPVLSQYPEWLEQLRIAVMIMLGLHNPETGGTLTGIDNAPGVNNASDTVNAGRTTGNDQ